MCLISFRKLTVVVSVCVYRTEQRKAESQVIF